MILDTPEKLEEARKSPKEKKPGMAVDETFLQGRVGMNRARKAAAGEERRAKEKARGRGKKVGPRATMGKIKRETKGGKKMEIERAEKCDARASISHCKVFRATAGRGEGTAGRMADRTARMHDERRKGGEREKIAVSVDGRLLRPCSRSFPLNSSASGSGEKSTHGVRGAGEWSRRMTRESAVGEGKRSA